MPINKINLRKSLTIAGGLVGNSIREKTSGGSPKYPKEIPASIVVDPVVETQTGASVDIVSDGRVEPLGPKLALTYELGSGIHGEMGAKYPIEPKEEGGKLIFPISRWTNYQPPPNVDFAVIPGLISPKPYVMHPGIEARPFIKRSWDSVKDDVLELVADDVVAQILPEYKR